MGEILARVTRKYVLLNWRRNSIPFFCFVTNSSSLLSAPIKKKTEGERKGMKRSHRQLLHLNLLCSSSIRYFFRSNLRSVLNGEGEVEIQTQKKKYRTWDFFLFFKQVRHSKKWSFSMISCFQLPCFWGGSSGGFAFFFMMSIVSSGGVDGIRHWRRVLNLNPVPRAIQFVSQITCVKDSLSLKRFRGCLQIKVI